MRLQDYSLSAELHYGYYDYICYSLSEPVALDLSAITQIYLKYHGFKYAYLFMDYDLDLHLSFNEVEWAGDRIISHSVVLPSPVHISDLRITLVPELIKIFNNYNIANGAYILGKMCEIQKRLRNED